MNDHLYHWSCVFLEFGFLEEWPWCLQLLEFLERKRGRADRAAYTATLLACAKVGWASEGVGGGTKQGRL